MGEYRSAILAVLKETMLSRAQCGEADFKQLEQEVGDVVAAAVKLPTKARFPDFSSPCMPMSWVEE